MTAVPRVLVAEDDAMLREILEEGLAAQGFKVAVAEDGIAGLELFSRSGPFDAVLADEEMPRMTGRQMLEELRARGVRVPALLISGNLELSDDECRALGVGPVLRKPISIEALARALYGVLVAPAR